jgi:hypothetical protein
VINSRRMRWAGHVAHIGEIRNSYKILVVKPDGRRLLGRPRRRWEDNMKIYDRCSEVRFPAGAGNFSLLRRIQTSSGVHPGSYSMGTRDSFPGGKVAGLEADHSPPPSTEVNNTWSYTSTPQCVFMAWCLVKHRDYFNF